MRWRGWIVTAGLVGTALGAGGCVSLDEHTRLQALNRNLQAEKESLAQELFDARSASDALKARADSCDRALVAKEELIANLRGENELLDEMRRTAQGALEKLGGRFDDLVLAAPALPAPLDNALRQFAEAHPDAVMYDPLRGIVKWKADLLFALGSDVVRESSLGTLKHFSEVINSAAAADFEVVVVGHTDTTPIRRSETQAKHPTNWHLSAHRAIAVGDELQRNGYGPDRIGVMGCGEYRPAADNATAEGKAQNRRVDIYLVKRGWIVASSIPTAGAPGTPITK